MSIRMPGEPRVHCAPIGVAQGLACGVARTGRSLLPSDVSGLKLWLEPSSANIVQTSGLVSQWNDISGFGNHAVQATTATKPIWSPVSPWFNRRPTLAGGTTTTPRYVTCNGLVSIPNGTAKPITIICVVNTTDYNPGHSPTMLSFSSSTTGAQLSLSVGAGSVKATFTDDATAGGNYNSTAVLDKGMHVFALTIGAGVLTLEADGVVVGAFALPTMGAVTLDTLWIGGTAFTPTLHGWVDSIAEIAIYDRALTTGERLGIARNLRSKYDSGYYATPESIFGVSNMRQWCRADTQIAFATGVSLWGDITGEGGSLQHPYTQATTAEQAAWVTDAALGSCRAIKFDGVNDWLGSGLNLPSATIGTPTTIIFVIKPTFAAAQYLFNSQQPAIDGKDIGVYFPGGGGAALGTNANTFNLFATASVVSNAWTRYRVDFSGDAGVGRDRVVWGGSSGSNNGVGVSTADTTGRKISSPAGVAPLDASLWELIYLSTPPTTQQMADYDAYLARTVGAGLVLV